MLALRRRPIDLSLYLVTGRQPVKNCGEFFSRIERAVRGGVTCVQLRDQDFQNCLKRAYHLKDLLDRRNIPLIVNNRVDVALAVNAGVYTQTDSKFGFWQRESSRDWTIVRCLILVI